MSNNLRNPFQHELEIDNSQTVDMVQYFAQDKQFLTQAIKDLEFKIAFKTQEIEKDVDLLEKLLVKANALSLNRKLD